MILPLNCSVEYLSDFLNNTEANNLFEQLIAEYKIDQSQLIVEAAAKTIKTDSFKILFSTNRLIEQNAFPQDIHGKSYAWTGMMSKLRKNLSSGYPSSYTITEYQYVM